MDGKPMTNDPTRAAFDRVKNILTEINGLRDDLADLKVEYVEANSAALTAVAWGDIVAVARKAVMDSAAREKAERNRKRRDELEGQLGLDL